MAASQFMQMGNGRFNSLSSIQFGSTSLTGRDLNIPANQGAEIAVGDAQAPLPMKQDTMGSNNAVSAWQKRNLMPHSKRTQGSTFSFGE